MKYTISLLLISFMTSCVIRNDTKINRGRQFAVVDAYAAYCGKSGSYVAGIPDLVRMGYLPEFSEIYSDESALFWKRRIRFSECKWILVAKSRRDVVNLRTIALQVNGRDSMRLEYYYPSDPNIHAYKKIIDK